LDPRLFFFLSQPDRAPSRLVVRARPTPTSLQFSSAISGTVLWFAIRAPAHPSILKDVLIFEIAAGPPSSYLVQVYRLSIVF